EPSPRCSARYASGRPDMTATRRYREARRPRTEGTPANGRAWSGSATMGARVPSKSRKIPDVSGEDSQGRSRRTRLAGRLTSPTWRSGASGQVRADDEHQVGGGALGGRDRSGGRSRDRLVDRRHRQPHGDGQGVGLTLVAGGDDVDL